MDSTPVITLERKETEKIEMMTVPRGNNDTIELNSQQVRNEVLEAVGTEFELQMNSYKYKPTETWGLSIWEGHKIWLYESGELPFIQPGQHISERSGEEAYGTFLILSANSVWAAFSKICC